MTTKFGDCGQTRLLSGEIVSKTHPRICALGTVDELVSILGVFQESVINPICNRPYNPDAYNTAKLLRTIQAKLFILGSQIASTEETQDKISGKDIGDLEKLSAYFQSKFTPPQGFIVPGNFKVDTAYLDVCRALTRRLERDIVSIEESVIGYDSIRSMDDLKIWKLWLNRLSDVLWLLARYLEHYDCI